MERQSLNISQWLWWLERDALHLGYYSSDTDIFTSPTTAGKKVTIFYIQRPDKFLVPGEGPERDGFEASDVYLGVSLDSNVQMATGNFDNQVAEVPPQFHEGIINRAIARGYEKSVETIKLAQYFDAKYDMSLRDAKRYSSRGRDGSQIVSKPMEF
tara:strand:- start:41 stop:508 length:468 start_codon:yes stop_codon:yes gene_type:complete